MFLYSQIPFTRVTIKDAFWSERQRVNHERSLPKQYDMCERTGRFDALRLQWTPGQPNRPHIFWDSDTAKWLEAACYACQIRDDAKLREKINRVARLFVEAQLPDGYINSYFSQIDPDRRWKNLRHNHELYCAGHIFEAAVAHYELTGEKEFLDAACRYADYIDSVFGLGEGKIPGYCGHEEIELALVRLYQATGNKRYLDLSCYFVEQRGKQPNWFKVEQEGVIPSDFQGHGFVDDYTQSHVPVREQKEVCGHAVRAVYLYCAMADLARETKDPTMLAATERLWKNLVNRKLYVTGGIGSSWVGEAFSPNYDLPNERAYCETCASVGLAFWAHRMLQHGGERGYADVIERALYNGALSGMSIDGESFFYQNPLASYGGHHRQSWFECSCCPSNLSRLLGTLGSYIYSEGDNELLVHLYIGSEAQFCLKSGAQGKLRQTGETPWQGNSRFELTLDHEQEMELRFRIPDWASSEEIRINGVMTTVKVVEGYARICRRWQSGDEIALHFTLPIKKIVSNPHVVGNNGQVALQRGPFIYCIEDTDFKSSVLNIALKRDAELTSRFEPDLLGGMIVIDGTGLDTTGSDTEGGLYLDDAGQQTEPAKFRAIPYFAWDNRSPGAMRVWILQR